MITLSERTELAKRIRSLEGEYFPGMSGQILSHKAVDAIISYGEAQKALHKEGWLEKQVKTKCENQLRNAKGKLESDIQKLSNAIKKEDKKKEKHYEPPRALKAASCSHKMIFTLSEVPDYQEQKGHYRIALSALEFDYEAHIATKTWEFFLNQVKRATEKGRSWNLIVIGELADETDRGFLLKTIKIDFKLRLPNTRPASPASKKSSKVDQSLANQTL